MEQHRYEPQIGALLRMVWEDLQDEIFSGLQAAGFGDFRQHLRSVMRYPPIDGLRPGELAIQRGLSKQATNDIVRELESRDYIRLERDPSDGRARIIRFTDRGWQFFDQASRLSREVGRRWAQEIGEEQYAHFETALHAIVSQRSSE